jgi:hypothetical protein
MLVQTDDAIPDEAILVDDQICGKCVNAEIGTKPSRSEYWGHSMPCLDMKSRQACWSLSALKLIKTNFDGGHYLVSSLNWRNSFPARRTPGGPRIHDDDLSRELIECNLLAVKGGDLEWRREGTPPRVLHWR